MKKLLILGLILTLATGVMATELQVWQVGMANETVKIIQELIEDYFTPETGIIVHVSTDPWEAVMSKVLLAVASGEPPDIIAGAPDHLVEYGIRGAIVPLRPTYGAAYEKVEAGLFRGTSEALNFRNQGYGFVESVGGIIGYQRKDILEDLGLEYPVTWSELYAMLPRLNAQGYKVGWGYGGPAMSPQWGALTLMKQHGGGFVHPDEFYSLFDHPGSVAGFTEYVQQFTVYNMPKEVEWFNMFKDGLLAILFDTTVRYANFDRGAPELAGRWSYGLVPGTPQADGSISHEAMLGGSALGIARQSKNQAAAFQYLQWYFSDEIQTKLVTAIPERMPGAMWIPGNSAAARAIPVREADQAILVRQLESSKAFSYYPGGMAINRYIEFAVHEVLQRGTTPAAALAQTHRQTEQELRSKRQEYERFMQRNIVQ